MCLVSISAISAYIFNCRIRATPAYSTPTWRGRAFHLYHLAGPVIVHFLHQIVDFHSGIVGVGGIVRWRIVGKDGRIVEVMEVAGIKVVVYCAA